MTCRRHRQAARPLPDGCGAAAAVLAQEAHCAAGQHAVSA